MTNNQIEQKKQQLRQLTAEAKAIYNELAEAGAISLSEDELDKVTGGKIRLEFTPPFQPPTYGDLPNALEYPTLEF